MEPQVRGPRPGGCMIGCLIPGGAVTGLLLLGAEGRRSLGVFRAEAVGGLHGATVAALPRPWLVAVARFARGDKDGRGVRPRRCRAAAPLVVGLEKRFAR